VLPAVRHQGGREQVRRRRQARRLRARHLGAPRLRKQAASVPDSDLLCASRRVFVIEI